MPENTDISDTRKEAPAVAYLNDFVFGKDLYVQGDVKVGRAYTMIEPHQFTDRKSNGFYATQLPTSYTHGEIVTDEEGNETYVGGIRGKIHLIESQLSAIREGSTKEDEDGAGDNIWLVLYKVRKEDMYSSSYNPSTAQYIGTSLNCINYPVKAYGTDFLVQFTFDNVDYSWISVNQDGSKSQWMLRIAVFNETLTHKKPSHTSQDLIDIENAKHGYSPTLGKNTEPVRFRRAFYIETEDGQPDAEKMTSEGAAFWSAKTGVARQRVMPNDFTPLGNPHGDPVLGIPLIRIFYHNNDDTSAFFSLSEKVNVMRRYEQVETTVLEMVKWWRENQETIPGHNKTVMDEMVQWFKTSNPQQVDFSSMAAIVSWWNEKHPDQYIDFNEETPQTQQEEDSE